MMGCEGLILGIGRSKSRAKEEGGLAAVLDDASTLSLQSIE